MSNSSDNMNWAAAATLMTLSVSLRCSRDFRYYRSPSPEPVRPAILMRICERLQGFGYNLHNLLLNRPENSRSPDGSAGAPSPPPETTLPFLFLLGRSVHDELETLHRELLFHDPDKIAGIIPLIDRERRFWREYDQAAFYDSEELILRLEHETPSAFREMESAVREL